MAVQTNRARQVLWTGGLDSTFRVCYLLLVEKVDVQPIYIIDMERRSTIMELKAMSRITTLLRRRASAKLLPTVMYNRHDFTVPHALKEAFEKLREQTHIGSQYLWLAAIGEALGWSDVEMSLHLESAGTAPWKSLIFANWPNSRLRDTPEAQLFKYWSFPLLYLTKEQMLDEARGHQFDDVLMLRWFCHSPIGTFACGRCAPCRQTQQENSARGVRFVPAPLRWISLVARLAGR